MVGCWINLDRRRFTHTACFSGRCLPSCRALLMCSRSPGLGSPCSLCVLCWAFSEAPSFPANARIVAAWFPAKERGTASAIFNAAQYFSLALFSPLLGWLTFALGWEHVFTVMGIIGFVLTVIWVKFVHNPTDHPRMSAAELKYISEGGAVVDMDHKKETTQAAGPKMDYIRQLLTNRMMLGVFFRSVFPQHHYLVLPDVVSDLPRAGQGNVNSESRLRGFNSGAVWFCRRRTGRAVFGLSDWPRLYADFCA
ncbi:MFS transporter [Klebsiella variicola subsp. variicola]|nr:MFS transporter [Klebsiella variicola subsp. variicola]